jgi:PAS domain-containing protein
MPQQAIEVILTRQLAAHLSMPTFLVDPEGRVLDFNEAARRVLGERLERARSVSARDLAALFEARDEAGELVPPEKLPLVIALEEHHPAHARLQVLGDDDQVREIAVTAVPLVGQGDRFLGAIAFFWDVGKGKGAAE